MREITKQQIAEFGKVCNFIADDFWDEEKFEEHKKILDFKNWIYKIYDDRNS